MGIDFYMPGLQPNVRNLGGCVKDVSRVEEYFTKRLGVPSSRVVKLTATRPHNVDGKEPTEPAEPASQWPTYENIIAAIQKVTIDAREGDSVYFHYSGHGARVATIFDNIKGSNTLDEALVPTNIRLPEGRYLRDVELAALINDMVKKNLTVTVVLDCCHSAGAVRLSSLANPSVRGLDEVDLSIPKIKISAIPHDRLVRSWQPNRISTLGNNWLLEARGYSLLAACRTNETAKENNFDGETHGVFTYWLLNSLELAWPRHTYVMLHNRIRAKTYTHNQTPVLAGEGNRVFFGIDRIKPIYSINVLRCPSLEVGSSIVIDAGQAHCVSINTELALYPRDVSDFTDAQRRIAIAKVVRVQSVSSTAELISVFDANERLETGCQAVVLRRNTVQKKYVRLVEQPNSDRSTDHLAALERVRTMLETNGDILAEQAEGIVDVEYQVTVNDCSEYEIRNSTGDLIPHLSPLKIESENGAEKLTDCLKHLTIYNNIRNLENSDPTSLLANKLEVRILGKLPSYHEPPDPKLGESNKPVSPLGVQPLDDTQGVPQVASGEWVILRIANLSSTTINISILDLEPSWGITQVYPSTDGTDFETLDGGQYLDLPLQMTIPESLNLGPNETGIVDIIKVFATVEPTSFLWLELPDLHQNQERHKQFSQPLNPLEELEAAITLQFPWRQVSRARYKATRWATEQIMVCTIRDNY